MIHFILNRNALLSAALAVPRTDQIIQQTEGEKTQETGWERVYKIFLLDEYGAISPQLSTIYQTTFFTGFFGACYGGFIQGREAYFRFIERNQATKFTDHFEAKKKLQDFVSINFAKGALKWSWRLALFSSFYITCVTVLSAYYGEPRIWHYAVGGLLSGGIYRINLGVRGVIVGSALGLMIGSFAGGLTSLILKFSGTSLDDVDKWRYELAESRNKHLVEASTKRFYEGKEKLLLEHDRRVTTNEDKEEVKSEKRP